jgi:ribonuclease R
VELEELFVEGLVHITTLDDDQYSYLEKQHSLIGRSLKQVFRIGDAARVRVAAVVPATRRVEFVLVGHTASAHPVRPGAGIASHEEYPRIPLRGKRVSSPGRRPEKDTKGGPGRGKKHPASKKRR